MAGSGTTGDVVANVPYFTNRTCKMYDIEPSDERIQRANILQTGIPEQSGTVDYVLLDPPHDFYPKADDRDFSVNASKAETMMKLKTIIREAVRILKSKGRVSIIVEPTVGNFGFIDFPFEVAAVMREMNMMPIGKVYLPRRGDKMRAHTAGEGPKPMVSECRELLTFEKA
jgi:hypothetical protein